MPPPRAAAAAAAASWCPRRLLPLAALATLLVALLAAAAPRPAAAYPAYFIAKNSACGAQPATAMGRHKAPQPDATTVFSVQGPAGKETRLCPGGTYVVTATFPQPRNALLSASVGAFDGSGCRVLTTSKVASVTGTYRVPCSAADGSRVVLRVTSATGGSGAFLQAGATLPVSAGCALMTCRGMPPARSG
jgi:hypothetical protein